MARLKKYQKGKGNPPGFWEAFTAGPKGLYSALKKTPKAIADDYTKAYNYINKAIKDEYGTKKTTSNNSKGGKFNYLPKNTYIRNQKGGMAMTNKDLNKIQAANENKNVMFGIMKDAYNRRKKKRGGATKMGMGGSCGKVILGKNLR